MLYCLNRKLYVATYQSQNMISHWCDVAYQTMLFLPQTLCPALRLVPRWLVVLTIWCENQTCWDWDSNVWQKVLWLARQQADIIHHVVRGKSVSRAEWIHLRQRSYSFVYNHNQISKTTEAESQDLQYGCWCVKSPDRPLLQKDEMPTLLICGRIPLSEIIFSL